MKKFRGYAKLLHRFYYICKKFCCPKKRGVKNDLFLEGKIGGDCGNFVRYAVAESATDAAERGQRVLAHFAEPRGGKACEAGLT